MRKWIDQLRKLASDFIEQRDDLMLLVACPPGETALLLNQLLAMEQERDVHLYYLFADNFAGRTGYVDTVAQRLRRDYEASLESPDIEPLPRPDLTGNDLHAALAYTRGLVPAATGHRVVWGLGPNAIANLDDYVALLSGCLPNSKIEPWMRGLRIIARVPEDFSPASALAKRPRVRFQRFAIPSNAAEVELRELACSTTIAEAARIDALLQLSFIDLAHSRFKTATDGLRSVLAYHQKTENLGMQALAMIGLGDCSRRAGDLDQAKYWYECAIIPAGEAKQLVCLSMIAQHLAAMAFDRRQYQDAIDYYEQLVTLKRAISDEDGLCEALIWRGKAQDKAGQADAALASWEEAILVCKTFDLDYRADECLANLKRGYEAVGKRTHGEQVIREWKVA
jgi:tetratricopeptide (TPR) repeat protein